MFEPQCSVTSSTEDAGTIAWETIGGPSSSNLFHGKMKLKVTLTLIQHKFETHACVHHGTNIFPYVSVFASVAHIFHFFPTMRNVPCFAVLGCNLSPGFFLMQMLGHIRIPIWTLRPFQPILPSLTMHLVML